MLIATAMSGKWNRGKEFKKNKSTSGKSKYIQLFSSLRSHVHTILETRFQQNTAKECGYEHVYLPDPLKKMPLYSTKMNIWLDFSS